MENKANNKATQPAMSADDDKHFSMMADPVEALSNAADHLADAGVLVGGTFAVISNLVKMVQNDNPVAGAKGYI